MPFNQHLDQLLWNNCLQAGPTLAEQNHHLKYFPSSPQMRILVLQERTGPYFIQNRICHLLFISSAVYLRSQSPSQQCPSEGFQQPHLYRLSMAIPSSCSMKHMDLSPSALETLSQPALTHSHASPQESLGCLQPRHHLPNLQAIAQACLFITFLMSHHPFIKPRIQFTSQ